MTLILSDESQPMLFKINTFLFHQYVQRLAVMHSPRQNPALSAHGIMRCLSNASLP